MIPRTGMWYVLEKQACDDTFWGKSGLVAELILGAGIWCYMENISLKAEPIPGRGKMYFFIWKPSLGSGADPEYKDVMYFRKIRLRPGADLGYRDGIECWKSGWEAEPIPGTGVCNVLKMQASNRCRNLGTGIWFKVENQDGDRSRSNMQAYESL